MEFTMKTLVIILIGLFSVFILVLLMDYLAGGSMGLVDSTFGKIGNVIDLDFGR